MIKKHKTSYPHSPLNPATQLFFGKRSIDLKTAVSYASGASGFGSVSSPRFGNSGIYDLFGDSCSRSLNISQIQYRTSLFLFGCTVHVHAIMGQSEVAGQVTSVRDSRYSGQSRREVDGRSVVKLSSLSV